MEKLREWFATFLSLRPREEPSKEVLPVTRPSRDFKRVWVVDASRRAAP